MTDELRRWILAAVAVILVVAALAATLAALFTFYLACENRSSEACGRQELAAAQFAIAIGGLLPAGVLVISVIRRRRRHALVSLAIVIVVYLVWALLNDAAVHGWSDLKLV